MFDFEPIQLRDNLLHIKYCTEDGESNPRPGEGASRCRAAVVPAAPLCRRQADRRREMSTIQSTAARGSISAASAARSGFVRSIGIWVHCLTAYWRRRAAIKTLHELDDRALRDIGLERDQIETAIYGIERLR
jgi:uncharacterized protein YjiS (DUF1127 family)